MALVRATFAMAAAYLDREKVLRTKFKIKTVKAPIAPASIGENIPV
jgi:hypothetical protein